jgi:hypothetical protein
MPRMRKFALLRYLPVVQVEEQAASRLSVRAASADAAEKVTRIRSEFVNFLAHLHSDPFAERIWNWEQEFALAEQ